MNLVQAVPFLRKGIVSDLEIMREFLVFSKNLVIHCFFQFILEFLFLTLQLSSAHSESEMFCIKGITKNLSKFMGKHLFQSLHKKDALAKVFSFEF